MHVIWEDRLPGLLYHDASLANSAMSHEKIINIDALRINTMIQHFTVVDEHTHTYPTEVAAKVLAPFAAYHELDPIQLGNGTIEEVVSAMHRDGIDYTVLANFAPAHIVHRNNCWTLAMAQQHPQLIPLVSLHPDMEGDLLGHFLHYLALGAKGLKIHPSIQEFHPNDPKMQEVYAYCDAHAIPVVFHCGFVSRVYLNDYADLAMMLPVIDAYRHLPIVLTHMAEGNADDVFRIAEQYPHVRFDTSIAISGKLCFKRLHDLCWQDDAFVVAVIRRVGAERFVFGSDYPFGSPIHDVTRFLRMPLTDDEKRLIVGGNALELFGMSETGIDEACGAG